MYVPVRFMPLKHRYAPHWTPASAAPIPGDEHGSSRFSTDVRRATRWTRTLSLSRWTSNCSYDRGAVLVCLSRRSANAGYAKTAPNVITAEITGGELGTHRITTANTANSDASANSGHHRRVHAPGCPPEGIPLAMVAKHIQPNVTLTTDYMQRIESHCRPSSLESRTHDYLGTFCAELVPPRTFERF